VRSVN